jgi:hypothetical protein
MIKSGSVVAAAVLFPPALLVTGFGPSGSAAAKAARQAAADATLTATLAIGWRIQSVKPAALGAHYVFVRSPENQDVPEHRDVPEHHDVPDPGPQWWSVAG